MYRRMSSSVGLHVPPTVLMLLKVTTLYYTIADANRQSLDYYYYDLYLSYEERPKECGLTTLETGRLRRDQIEVF